MVETSTMIEAGIGLVLFVYVIASLVPGAMTALVNGTTAGGAQNIWGTSIAALWGILGVFVAIAVILMIYAFAKERM